MRTFPKSIVFISCVLFITCPQQHFLNNIHRNHCFSSCSAAATSNVQSVLTRGVPRVPPADPKPGGRGGTDGVPVYTGYIFLRKWRGRVFLLTRQPVRASSVYKRSGDILRVVAQCWFPWLATTPTGCSQWKRLYIHARRHRTNQTSTRSLSSPSRDSSQWTVFVLCHTQLMN